MDEVELGRNLAIAVIATRHGIGLDYARKKYGDQPVGEFWISLARLVIDHWAKTPTPSPRTPTMIQ